MHALKKSIEAGMDKYLVKKAPLQLPANGKKAIVDWAPWIALVIGVLSLLSALSLWNLVREVSRGIDYSYDISRSLGIEATPRDVGLMVYISIAVLIIQGVILLIAFKGLQARSKARGWDMLLLSTLLGLVYGLSTLFITDYRSGADFIFSLLGTLVGLYILAQIRGSYNGRKTAK